MLFRAVYSSFANSASVSFSSCTVCRQSLGVACESDIAAVVSFYGYVDAPTLKLSFELLSPHLWVRVFQELVNRYTVICCPIKAEYFN